MHGGRRGGAIEWLAFVLAILCFAYGYRWGTGEERPATPGERFDDGLRIVTWNVGAALDGELQPLADADVPAVARLLEELRPDLCFLQEVKSARQVTLLRRQLGEDWSAELVRSGAGRRIVALSATGSLAPGEELAGGALTVTLTAPDGRRVRAIGVHADAYSARERNELLGAAVDALAAAEGDGLRILAGDFNLDMDLDKRRDLFSDDAYLDVETYNYVSARLSDAARGTGATAEPDRRLDYVFVGSEAGIVRAAGPLRGRRIGAMDHDPLVVDLGPGD